MSEEKILEFEAPIYFKYSYTAGKTTTSFLNSIKKGKLVGQKCPKCRGVYVPPRGSCPKDGVATEEEIELPDIGTVESFTINYLPIPGGAVDPPYVSANIILDGADLAFMHIVDGIDHSEVRVGMRVKAHWKPKNEWKASLENIAYFQPIDEPDLPLNHLSDEKNA
tara:strand:- start:3077 stop:3574 length:498 start_codon:yes stop_codon:yes gene_type:complete